MKIDIHIHTRFFSSCSDINFEEAIIRAKKIGLDGICITDHDSRSINEQAGSLSRKYDYLVIVGSEINTYEGDILVFGQNSIPRHKVHAQDLINMVNKKGGICICAHPFRDNGRSIGEKLLSLKGLAGIEAFNGNTTMNHNKKAYDLGKLLHLHCMGGSDAHKIDNIGKYATCFRSAIKYERDFIVAIRNGEGYPVALEIEQKKFVRL